MDFFDRQENARRQTLRLLVLFGLSVVVIILTAYLLAVVALHSADGGQGRRHVRASEYWDPGLLLLVAGGTTLVVAAGSLYKIAELASGGEAVALMLGGRPIDPQTTEPAERRLMNIVEEMAIASGVAVPPVYVLDSEPSINAFAAGYQPGDAVVAVSRGCLEYLNRDEVQGVVAHEFSHILNGDMRLNLRLVGIVHGILLLSIIGYYLMRSVQGARYSSSRDSKKGDGTAAIFAAGLTLYILGYLGVFLGQIIRSAISRQREYLADASAVQFTRNPPGIAGALKKIGGLAEGSHIRDQHAAEVSHMFFGNAMAGSFLNLFATHPPLVDRIRAIDPQFDGRFPEVRPLVERDQPAERREGRRPAVSQAAVAGLSGAAPNPQRAVEQVGHLGTEQIEHASRLLGAMPPELVAAAREPFSARAVIFALLLARQDGPTRDAQVQLLQQHAEPSVVRLTMELAPLVDELPPELRLPLVELAAGVLKRMSPSQYQALRAMVDGLTGADGRIDLMEYCLRVVLLSDLDLHYRLRRPSAVAYRSIAPVAGPAVVVLSTLAYVGQREPHEIERAFRAGAEPLLGAAALMPQAQCSFRTFDAALAELDRAAPAVKRGLLQAAAACISADRVTTIEELELLRAVAAALGCPMPPGLGN